MIDPAEQRPADLTEPHPVRPQRISPGLHRPTPEEAGTVATSCRSTPNTRTIKHALTFTKVLLLSKATYK